jgi:hypothetical protein
VNQPPRQPRERASSQGILHGAPISPVELDPVFLAIAIGGEPALPNCGNA